MTPSIETRAEYLEPCAVPFGEREICQLGDRLGHEIIRRRLQGRPSSLDKQKAILFLQRQTGKAAGEWRDGKWFPAQPTQEVLP